MAERESIRNKIIVGVVSASAVALLGYIGRAWWPPAWHGIIWFFGLLCAWLRTGHPVYGWLLVIFILCATTCCFALLAPLFRRAPGHNWRSYRRDTLFGIVWRWDYYGQQIGDPAAYCLQCDTQLIVQEDYDYGSFGRRRVTYYICDHCSGTNEKFDEAFRDTQNKVIRQIERKLRNDEWKMAVSGPP